MNYYQFHVGDYAAHTRNLGLLEDLAYRRMLDAYYVNERPFVGSVQDVAREIGMREHIEDVEYVLSRFFVRDGDTWTNKRADAEIEKFKDKSEKAAKAGRASAERRFNERSTDVEKKETGVDTNPTDVQPTNNQEPITNKNPPSPPSGVAKPKREKPRSRCSPDFAPSEAGAELARSHGLDVQAELRRFIDHHTATGSMMADWQAAWRTWVSRAVEFGRGRPLNAAGPKRGSDEYAALHRTATWWREAGFDTVYDAIASRCWHDNAENFRDGKRVEVSA